MRREESGSLVEDATADSRQDCGRRASVTQANQRAGARGIEGHTGGEEERKRRNKEGKVRYEGISGAMEGEWNKGYHVYSIYDIMRLLVINISITSCCNRLRRIRALCT